MHRGSQGDDPERAIEARMALPCGYALAQGLPCSHRAHAPSAHSICSA